MLSAPTTPIRSPSDTESDGIGGATADQQHGGVASGIDSPAVVGRAAGFVGKPAHHGGMQGPDPQAARSRAIRRSKLPPLCENGMALSGSDVVGSTAISGR